MHRPLIGLLLFINILLLIAACQNEQKETKKVDPNEAATPHGSTLPGLSLSKEDQKKLAEATGIVATPMYTKDLVHLIDKGSQGLNLYCLWKLNSPKSDELLQTLVRLRGEIDEVTLAIHHINVNDLEKVNQVNSHIRALGLINNNYILAGVEDYEQDQPYAKLFHSELPVLILSNNRDGTKLIYKQVFTFEELYALIQPLTI